MTGARTRMALESHNIIHGKLDLQDGKEPYEDEHPEKDGGGGHQLAPEQDDKVVRDNDQDQQQEQENQEELQEDETLEGENSAHGFAQDQLDDIELLLAQQIQVNAKVSTDLVRSTMWESLSLIHQSSDECVVKKVYDRVRYLKEKQHLKTIAAIESVEKDQYVSSWLTKHNKPQDSTATSRSRREGWDEEDFEIIIRLLIFFYCYLNV